MDNKLIIKTAGIIICLIALICVLAYNCRTNREDLPVPQAAPEPQSPVEKKFIPRTHPSKPIMRDENQMPKSDYKVPEIG